MEQIDNLLQNIQSIGYFLASKKDILSNEELIDENGVVSDIIDLKLADLKYNVEKIRSIIEQKRLSDEQYKTLNNKSSMDSKQILKIKVCVASSSELKEERKEIEDYLAWKNDELIDKGIYLVYNVWEKRSGRFNHTQKQEDFNKELVYDSEIFICLIGSFVGKFTKVEFDEAKQKFDKGEKPYIFNVLFKKYKGEKLEEISETKGWRDRSDLKDAISGFDQIYSEYENKDALIRYIDAHIEEDIEIIKAK